MVKDLDQAKNYSMKELNLAKGRNLAIFGSTRG
jgi:hypothetical protein